MRRSRGRGFESARTPIRLLLVFLSFLIMLPMAHATVAPWQPAVFVALLASVTIIVLAYFVVTFLHLESFKAIIRDELLQVFLTAVIALVLLAEIPNIETGLSSFMCAMMQPQICAHMPDPPQDLYGALTCRDITIVNSQAVCPANLKINDWALQINSAQTQIITDVSRSALAYSNKISEAGAKLGFVNFLGVGMGIPGCSAYGVLRGPLGQLLNASGFALMDLEAERILLTMNYSVVLTLLLPAGIVLRALNITRKVGSTLIALAISLYLVFPAALLFGQSLADHFILMPETTDASGSLVPFPYISLARVNALDPGTLDCDPFRPDESGLVSKMNDLIDKNAQWLVFWVVARTLLMTAFALSVTFGATRAFAHLMNTEVDVSAIARLS